jgi:anti-sigma28 factor (negative regulator of flagellin synthesis)
MKRHDQGRAPCTAELETERVFEGFDAARSERLRKEEEDERVRRIARLKSEVRSGRYRPDVKDIARLLTSAMDPTL